MKFGSHQVTAGDAIAIAGVLFIAAGLGLDTGVGTVLLMSGTGLILSVTFTDDIARRDRRLLFGGLIALGWALLGLGEADLLSGTVLAAPVRVSWNAAAGVAGLLLFVAGILPDGDEEEASGASGDVSPAGE